MNVNHAELIVKLQSPTNVGKKQWVFRLTIWIALGNQLHYLLHQYAMDYKF